MSLEIISSLYSTHLQEDDLNKLNELEQISLERIYILSLISKRIEDFLKQEQSTLKSIRNYFHLPICKRVEENMILELKQIINNYQVNDINTELKKINEMVKKMLHININDFRDNETKDDKFFKLNEDTLVIAKQNSIILKNIHLNNNIQNNLHTFIGEIKNCCAIRNKILLSVNEKKSYKLKLIENESKTDLYESNNEITFISKSNFFSDRIYFIEQPKTIYIYDIYEKKKIMKISLMMNIYSCKEITKEILFFASYNSWCFYFLGNNDGGEIKSDIYNGNIFNPEEIFLLTNPFLMLGGKKYFFIFNIEHFELKIKIRLKENTFYSCVCFNDYDKNICVYLNNEITIYELKKDNNNKINLFPLIVKTIDYQVYSLIYSNRELLIYKGKQEFELMSVE